MVFHTASVRLQLVALLACFAAVESSEPLTETCLGEECELALDSSSPGLNLLQTNAVKHVKGNPGDHDGKYFATSTTFTTKTTTTTTMLYTGPQVREVAYVNMMRHGEKCEKDGIYLDKLGYARGKYLARCFTSPKPSKAMPFGTKIVPAYLKGPLPQSLQPKSQTRVLVGGGILTDSIRPLITALPLLEKLNISLDMPCSNHTDPGCMANNIFPLMTNHGTVIVMDTYQMLPYELALLNVPASGGYDFNTLNHWPGECDPPSAPHFKEPHCTVTDAVPDLGFNNSFPYEPESSCFDQIWQIKFTRNCIDETDRTNLCGLFNMTSGIGGPYYGWQAESITTMSEGFDGNPDAPCAGDLYHGKPDGQ